MNPARLKLQWSNITWAKVETLRIKRRIALALSVLSPEEVLQAPEAIALPPETIQLPPPILLLPMIIRTQENDASLDKTP